MNKVKPVITLDIDGVIAGGEYDPKWGDNPNHFYFNLPIMDEWTRSGLKELNERYDVYYITSRAFPDATLVTYNWFNALKLPLGRGIITGVASKDKAYVSDALNSEIHVDDNPLVISTVQDNGNVVPVIFVGRSNEGSWWPDTEKCLETNLSARNWEDLIELITPLVGLITSKVPA